MSSDPSVAVIVPVYDGAVYFAEALRSALTNRTIDLGHRPPDFLRYRPFARRRSYACASSVLGNSMAK
jgi:hypothetical protein